MIDATGLFSVDSRCRSVSVGVWRTVVLLVLSGLVSTGVHGGSVVIGAEDMEVPLGKHLHYLEDPTGEMTLEGFLGEESQSRLVLSEVDIPSFGLTRSAYWVEFDVTNTGKSDRKMLLEFDYPLLDDIRIFQYINGELKNQYELGDLKPFSERLIDHRRFLIPLELRKGDKSRIVIRVVTTSSAKVGLTLHGQSYFWQNDGKETGIQGIYFGIMAVMIIYNGFLTISLRSKVYLFYVVYVFAFTISRAILQGWGYQYLWQDLPFFHDKSYILFEGVTTAYVLFFSILFLDARNSIPRLSMCMYLVGFLSIFQAMISFFLPYELLIKILLIKSMITMTIMIVAGIIRTKHQSLDGFYFLMAFSILIIGTLLGAFAAAGVIETNFLTIYSEQIGSAAEVILLSLALASRIKRLQEENLLIQKEASDTLQQKVDERTQDLQAAKKESDAAHHEAVKAHKEAVEAHIEADALKQQAIHQAEQLKELDQQKTAFFQNMSHELRTPLTLILNPLENLMQKIPEDQDAAIATKNSRRLLRLVNQLLDFQKLKAGKKDLNLAPLDISMLTHVCGDYFASACKAKEVSFSLDQDGKPITHEGEPLMVMGEIDALEKITFNYLSNALKHTPKGGKIQLGLTTTDDKVRLYVSDTGAGISADDQEKLFQVFSQVDASTTRAYEDSGLGLALVRSLAEEMGGAVGIDSIPGEGSNFWVEFPILTEEAIAKLKAEGAYGDAHVLEADFEVKSWLLEEAEGKTGEGDQEEQVVTDGDGARILVIDDLGDMRDLIGNSLQKRNYAVLKASNGKLGLEAAKTHQPDLIVTDWMMPEMSGPELIKQLKADPSLSTIPVVLLTAKSDEESKIIGSEIGADAFLGKPFNELELASVVKNLIQLTATNKREVRYMKDLLTQSEKLSQLGRMVSSIGHEISNPISLISMSYEGEAKLLEKLEKDLAVIFDADDEETKKVGSMFQQQIDEIRDVSSRIHIGSDRLKDLSVALRSQSRMELQATTDVDMTDLIQESILITKGKLKLHQLNESMGDVPAMTCFRSQVGQVLTNLLANAADALNEKVSRIKKDEGSRFTGQIAVATLATVRDGISGVTVSIADNGDGVPEGIREKIFDQFYTTKESGEGTGLGLSLCADIVREHGGTLSVTDDPELGGARFELWLPLTIAAHERDDQAA